VIALFISIAGVVVLNNSRPAAAADNSWFKNYLVAHGLECRQLIEGPGELPPTLHMIENGMIRDVDKLEVFGKRALDWSDEDLAEVLQA
jgi:hypothetical protein